MEILLNSAVKTFLLSARTLPIVLISLITVEILLRSGRLNRIYFLFLPLLKRTGLPPATSLSFITAIGSPLAAGTILKKFHNEKKINSFELLLAAQTNSLPRYFKEIFTRFIPIMIPILGIKPGIIYTVSFFFVGIVKFCLITLTGLIISRKKEKQNIFDDTIEHRIPEAQNINSAMINEILKKSIPHFLQIAKVMLIATFAVNIADESGILLSIQNNLRPILSVAGIKENMILPVLAYVGNATAGGLMIGTLYKKGIIDFYTASVSAMAGNLISFPLYLFKFSFARNMAVYGTKLGFSHVLITLIIGIIARLLFLLIFITTFKICSLF